MEQVLNLIVGLALIWFVFGGLTIIIYLMVLGSNFEDRAMPSIFFLWFIFFIPLIVRSILKLIRNLFNGTGIAFKQVFTKRRT